MPLTPHNDRLPRHIHLHFRFTMQGALNSRLIAAHFPALPSCIGELDEVLNDESRDVHFILPVHFRRRPPHLPTNWYCLTGSMGKDCGGFKTLDTETLRRSCRSAAYAR